MNNNLSKVKLSVLNAHLICALCGGYLIDPTMLTQCLHTFCKSCIFKYLEHNRYCPLCQCLIQETRLGKVSLKPDITLQKAIYKLVPNLLKSEMQNINYFYQHEEALENEFNISSIEKLCFLENNDKLNLSLTYKQKVTIDTKSSAPSTNSTSSPENESSDILNNLIDKITMENGIFLLCSTQIKVDQVKKLILNKYHLNPNEYDTNLWFNDDCLNSDYTLSEIMFMNKLEYPDGLNLLFDFISNK